MREIYLDNAASKPMSSKVIKSIAKASKEYCANPFSKHKLGLEAKKVLEEAKSELAKEIGVKKEEIILTSGGTESNALAIIGTARAKKREGKNKILISSIEHGSVYENSKMLEKEGFSVVEIPFSENKGLDLPFLEKSIDSRTALVSVVSINSDTGILNDFVKIGNICKKKGVVLHIDNSQGFGKIKMQAKNIGVDLMSADAHKIGGPKGVGFLYIRDGSEIEPLWVGSGKKEILRAGTENVPGAVGFVEALKETKKINWNKIGKLRDFMMEEMEKVGGRITCNKLEIFYPYLNICFKNIDGKELVNYLSSQGIYCSTGSACESDKEERRVLERMGVPLEYRKGAIRFSLSEKTNKKDVETTIKRISEFLNRFKNVN